MIAPVREIDSPASVHMHHTESVDPTLVVWINDLLHDLLGWGPWTFVVVLGIAIVLIPLWLIYTSLKNQAAADEHAEWDEALPDD